jgi:plasmid stability protein
MQTCEQNGEKRSQLVHLMLPLDLKRELEEAASRKGNSLSAEVRDRLFSSLHQEAGKQ